MNQSNPNLKSRCERDGFEFRLSHHGVGDRMQHNLWGDVFRLHLEAQSIKFAWCLDVFGALGSANFTVLVSDDPAVRERQLNFLWLYVSRFADEFFSLQRSSKVKGENPLSGYASDVEEFGMHPEFWPMMEKRHLLNRIEMNNSLSNILEGDQSISAADLLAKIKKMHSKLVKEVPTLITPWGSIVLDAEDEDNIVFSIYMDAAIDCHDGRYNTNGATLYDFSDTLVEEFALNSEAAIVTSGGFADVIGVQIIMDDPRKAKIAFEELCFSLYSGQLDLQIELATRCVANDSYPALSVLLDDVYQND